jgi:hypothetical protein
MDQLKQTREGHLFLCVNSALWWRNSWVYSVEQLRSFISYCPLCVICWAAEIFIRTTKPYSSLHEIRNELSQIRFLVVVLTELFSYWSAHPLQ